jgi:hypothetical protein
MGGENDSVPTNTACFPQSSSYLYPGPQTSNFGIGDCFVTSAWTA